MSWTIDTSLATELANTMLRQAIATLKVDDKLIIHSNQDGHNRWREWIGITRKALPIRSMSKKGYSRDNSACEGFFGGTRNEMFYERDWSGVSLKDFMKILDQYLHWYTNKRIEITLDGLSPNEFRKKTLSDPLISA